MKAFLVLSLLVVSNISCAQLRGVFAAQPQKGDIIDGGLVSGVYAAQTQIDDKGLVSGGVLAGQAQIDDKGLVSSGVYADQKGTVAYSPYVTSYPYVTSSIYRHPILYARPSYYYRPVYHAPVYSGVYSGYYGGVVAGKADQVIAK